MRALIPSAFSGATAFGAGHSAKTAASGLAASRFQPRLPAVALAPTREQPFTAPQTDHLSLSPDSQKLLNQPEQQVKKVLSLLEQMFGITNVTSMNLQLDVQHAHLVDASQHEQQSASAAGTNYDYQDSFTEASQTALNASGTITLADGRSFQLDMHYQHTQIVTSSRSVSIASSAPDADFMGTGKHLLDEAFPAGSMLKNLADALRRFAAPHRSDDAQPSLLATLEASTVSAQQLNAVFGHMRDLHQQREAARQAHTHAVEHAESVAPPKPASAQVDLRL